MGKTSLLRLWADSFRKDNIVFFFAARDICHDNWLTILQDKVYPEIEKFSSGRLQCPQHFSTIFGRMQSRLEAKGVFIYIFVDALNSASYQGVAAFFKSDDFLKCLREWNVNWVFSCHEAIWKEWKENLNIPNPFEYTLKEFSDKELESALNTHKIDLANVPHWMRPKLKWPGFLRLYELTLSNKPDIFKNMPEMALAEISLMFIRDRLDEFAKLHPGGTPMSRKGVEDEVNAIVALFDEEGYRTLPFRKIKERNDFKPHNLSENSWNILLQQGFLTKNQESYVLGNDWGSILIGKYLIDTCKRKDVNETNIRCLLDETFDEIEPIVTEEGQIRLDESERFEDILWFALHYGKICNIPESLFRMILDRIFKGQNLSHQHLSEVSARLFPQYTIRYLVNLSDTSHIAIYLREGLEKIPSEEVVPEVIKLFPHASEEVKLQMAILLEHHSDIRFIEDVYSLVDQNPLSDDKVNWHHIESRLKGILELYPDECCQIIQSRFEKGEIHNYDLAIILLGRNDNSKNAELLRKLIGQQPSMSATSIRAMGRLRMSETEDFAIKVLEGKPDPEMKRAAIEALGHLQSKLFYCWCSIQPDLWNRDYYVDVIRSLQNFESLEAYDLVISLELQQEKRIPFTCSDKRIRLRQINKKQFQQMVVGILNKIQHSGKTGDIRQGLYNLSTLNHKRFSTWWQEYKSTDISKIIAELAKFCAKPEYFDSRGQTEASMAIDEALKILNWINDKEVFVSLLVDLMERDIPRLFAWALFPFVVRYADQRYKDVLVKMAMYNLSHDSNRRNIYEQVQRKAIICLTHLKGNDVANTILKFRPNRYSPKDWEYQHSLDHFNKPALNKKLIDIISSKNEKLFWSAYCFLWKFLPKKAIEPSLIWLKGPDCKDWIRNYLLKLLGKYDRPECNRQLIKYLNNTSTQTAAMEALLYSKDPQIHDWFKNEIATNSLAPLNVFDEATTKKHPLFLEWINHNFYVEAEPYLHKWLEEYETVHPPAQRLIPLLYDTIAKLQFWHLLDLVKRNYNRWNPRWNSQIIKATLKLFYIREPGWTWSEFLEYWDNSSDLHKRSAIEWVGFMPSNVSVRWLIDIYPKIGNFSSDEKAIRKSVRRIISNFPDEIQQHGIELLKEKSISDLTKDRTHAAKCSSLFGEKTYKQFDVLFDDSCARVRSLYRYSDICETELISG